MDAKTLQILAVALIAVQLYSLKEEYESFQEAVEDARKLYNEVVKQLGW